MKRQRERLVELEGRWRADGSVHIQRASTGLYSIRLK